MKRKAPSTCPVCEGEYEWTTLTCKNCKSELKGSFQGCDFCRLKEEELHFILVFLKCRGSIKEVEKELGISYPTVKARLENVRKSLGLIEEPSKSDVRAKRKEIFDLLNEGKINADEAAKMLKKC